MEEQMDIILSVTDNASDTFEAVAKTGEEMGSSLEQAFEEANAEVERLREELDFAEEWGFVNDAEELEAQLSEAESEAERLGAALEEATSKGSDGFGEVEDSAEGAADPISQIGNILEGFVGAEVFSQLADTLWDFADKAGSFEDSMMRARLEAEGAGISVNEMTDTVSELSRVTGRAGGEIRESFIKATARGITDMDSFKKMMVGAGAQATLLGTDIQSMGDKFSSMAMRSTLMERQLASTGITMEELASAMGMTGATADEVKAKWEELDTNQRAAALGMAASMNEGQTANEEYKKSWAGLQEQLDIAKGRLERLAGEVLLPVLIPALEVAGRVLSWVGDVVQGVMDGPFGGLVSVIGTAAAAFALAVPAITAVKGAIGLFTKVLKPAIIESWELIAPWLPFILIGAAIVLLIYEIGKAFGWWTDVSSMMDAIWAGIQRLWSAFINHPDVQGFINNLKLAWSNLQIALTPVINAVLKFFNVQQGGEFDIVRALIDSVSNAWRAMTLPIRTVINIIKLVILKYVEMRTRAFFEINKIKQLFARLPGAIRGAISGLVGILTAPFHTAYSGISKTVGSIKSTIHTITGVNIGGLTSKLTKPVTDAYTKIAKTVGNIIQKIKSIPSNIPGLGGAFGFDYEGMLEELESKNKTTTYTRNDENLSLDHNINFSFDFTNLPEGTSEETLVAMLRSAITDRSVINSLVNSPDFQSLDGKVKDRLLLKGNRARGV